MLLCFYSLFSQPSFWKAGAKVFRQKETRRLVRTGAGLKFALLRELPLTQLELR